VNGLLELNAMEEEAREIEIIEIERELCRRRVKHEEN
jgi:hypothetical protein